jgi:hypothetical protein
MFYARHDIQIHAYLKAHNAILPAVCGQDIRHMQIITIRKLTSIGSNIINMAAKINKEADTKTGLQDRKTHQPYKDGKVQ